MNTSRRRLIRSVGVAVAGLSLTPTSLLARLLADELPYNMKLLRKNVGYFTERGGTIGWMVSEDGIIVVDSQFPEQSNHLIGAIEELSNRKIDLLINTHHHGDHSGGNISFKGRVNKVVAHNNSKKNQIRVAQERGNEDTQLYPDTTYEDNWKSTFGNETISLTYYGAAHTDGDSIIHFEQANIAHMGDLVFNRRHPYIDRSAGASIESWIKVLEETQKRFDTDTSIIFGHSRAGFDIVGNLADIRAKQDYLSRLLETVETAMKAGKNESEILKIPQIRGADQWTGRGIERNLTAAFQELSARKY